ncbi:alpha/beta hydrolase [Planctomycetota bacterium]
MCDFAAVIRPLLLFLGLFSILYLGAALFLYFGQNRFLYHPQRYSLVAAQEGARELALKTWPATGSDIQGYLAIQSPETVRGTVLVFHGNAGTALGRSVYVTDLEPLGLRVILVEYPGYGPCTGPLGEASLVSSARAVARQAKAEFPEPLYILGESLGCGVACAVAADPTCDIAGIILITPWNNLPTLAQDHYPWFPTRWLVRDTYDNAANLKDVCSPIAIVMAERDEIIPNPHTLALVRSLGDRTRLWTLQNVGHNDWGGAINLDWWHDIFTYLKIEL